MSLILAIEPDAGQSTRLEALVRRRLHAQLVQAPTTEGALAALAQIGDRVPDLVLIPSLLSPEEDAAIAGALRIIAAAANVRMLTIPLLAEPEQPPSHRGVFARLRGRKARTAPGGCHPDVFADQIAAYLAEAAAERNAAREDLLDQLEAVPATALPAGHDGSGLTATRASGEPDGVVEPVSIIEPVRSPEPVAVSEPVSGAAPIVAIEPVQVDEPVETPATTVAALNAERAAVLESDAAPRDGAAVATAPVVAALPRRRRGAARPPAKSDADLGALLAPLLVQIASQRKPEPGVEEVLRTAPVSPRAETPAIVPPAIVPPATVPPVMAPPVMAVPVMAPPAMAPPAMTPPVTAVSATVPPAAGIAVSHTPETRHDVTQEPAVAAAARREAAPAVAAATPTPDDIDPMFFADSPTPQPAGTPERSRWNELVESLRQDIHRLKAERQDGVAAPVAVYAAAETPAEAPAAGLSIATRASTPRRAPVVSITSAPSAQKTHTARLTPRRPTEDQWGLFDPEQCGFAALLAKLDELGTREDVPA